MTDRKEVKTRIRFWNGFWILQVRNPVTLRYERADHLAYTSHAAAVKAAIDYRRREERR